MRERRFKLAGLGRRGLEPDDVYAFLDRVAGDLAAVYAALAASRRETAVIKDALRRWQSDQARDARGNEPVTQRYVIHLPVVANDLPAAQRLARVAGRGCSPLPQPTRGRPPCRPRTTRTYATGSSATC